MKTALYTLSMFALLLSALACQDVREVGSACPDGVCRQAAPNSDTSVPCLVSNVVAEIAVEGLTDLAVCLPRPLPVDESGEVDCKLTLSMVTDESWCADSGLERFDEVSSVTGTVTCLVPQVAVLDGALADPDTRGWYYDDFSDDSRRECVGLEKQRIAATEGLVPLLEGAVAKLRCTQTRAATEDAAPSLDLPGDTVEVEISSCIAPTTEDANGVGDACVPRAVPEGGFDDSEAYLQTGADDCETGGCMVYHLRGDPRESCVPLGDPSCIPTETVPCGPVVLHCPTPDEVTERVYCTCRCDDGAGEGCDCPDGFSCVDVLDGVSDRLDGSYCVRNGRLAD